MPTPKRLTVFAARLLLPGRGQPTLIVAAPSRAAAVRAFAAAGVRSVTDGYLKTYGHQSGNAVHLQVATSRPGTVFVETIAGRGGLDAAHWEPYSRNG